MKYFFALLSAWMPVHAAMAQSVLQWGAVMDVAPAASGNLHPRIVLDASGNPLLVWVHADRLMYARWNAGSFSAPQVLNPVNLPVAGASWMGPEITAHGDTVYVVMKEIPEDSASKHIYLFHSYNGGLTFSGAVQVDNINDSLSRFPVVAIGPGGNPLVAFMKFDPSFGSSRWVVSRSTDAGNSFAIDHLASGWSGGSVCDCCPGALVCAGQKVFNLYRDELNNTRVIWSGVSEDGGTSFSSGFRADNTNWVINSCPATGPDAVVIGDSLYSVFHSSGSGNGLVYLNSSAVNNPGENTVALATGIPGLGVENYPRIDAFGNAAAIVWRQSVSGTDQLPILFTPDIHLGLPAVYDTVDLGNITTVDVAVGDGKVFVVWEDDMTGTMHYRIGTFNPISSTGKNPEEETVMLFGPNPAGETLYGNLKGIHGAAPVRMINMSGQVIWMGSETEEPFSIPISGLTNGIYQLQWLSNDGWKSRSWVKNSH